jgi:hypothetical protein
MITNPYNSWYTDTFSIYREQASSGIGLDTKQEVLVVADLPCRMYQHSKSQLKAGNEDVGAFDSNSMLACGINVDVRSGDKLKIIVGGSVGKPQPPVDFFAGEIATFLEPFGGVMPALEHKEVPLQKSRRANFG